jgi:hydroxyethylthiazole kinase-like uncharacterized protein yjeF
MRVLNASQMREADRRTISEIGVPSAVLMENAGRQVVAAMEASFENLGELHVAVLCGHGNNGGDGFVVARTLWQRGVEVLTFLVGPSSAVRGDARTNLDIVARLGLTVIELPGAQDWELHSPEVLGCDVIVDAMFGTGLTTPLRGIFETIVADLNEAGKPVVSIDLPSGLSADTADLIGTAVEADLTVTLGAPKLPLVLPPGDLLAGKLVVAEIGIPQRVIEEVDGPRIALLTPEALRPLVPSRARDAHKGSFGHVLIVAGSTGKTGAAHLSAMGALRSGAGLSTVATPASCLPIVASLGAEYMTVPLPESAQGAVVAAALDRVLDQSFDVIAAGPGLGAGADQQAFIFGLVERASVPLVLDADAVNAFDGHAMRLLAREGQTIIITPHPGEMARLTGSSVADVQRHRLDVARDFAVAHKLYVVLKGHRTLVATPDGYVFINRTGNPGMATAGSGDVLTGMIAAWMAQLRDAEAACTLAVYLHGAAGDLAEADEGEVAMTASDILAHLGDAVMELTARRRSPEARSNA